MLATAIWEFKRQVGVVSGEMLLPYLIPSVKQFARGTPYLAEAFCFVLQGFHFALHRARDRTQLDGDSLPHVTGRELCGVLRQFAIRSFGPDARKTLESWGVRSCEDFGTIVFRMVELGAIGASAEDSIEDFQNVFSFDEAFDNVAQETPDIGPVYTDLGTCLAAVREGRLIPQLVSAPRQPPWRIYRLLASTVSTQRRSSSRKLREGAA
jgi:uncharacterized repeat protein (TIGR04138 family)